MKKFPPRRRLWPAAALLCLLALPLLLPRLSGGRSAPAAPAQTAEEAEEGFAALDDKVYGVLLETALQRVRLVALKNRGIAGETEVPLPDGWNAAKVNVYCFVMSGTERMVSDSIFLPVSTQA